MNKEEKELIIKLMQEIAEMKEQFCGNSGLNWYNNLLIEFKFLIED